MRVNFLIIFIAAAILSFIGSQYIDSKIVERRQIREEQVVMRKKARERSFTAQEELWRKMQSARTMGDWEKLLPLGIAVKDPDLQNIIAAKILEGKFWRAKMLLSRARSLLEVDRNNPVARKYISEAKELYAEMDKTIKAVAERPDDPAWNTSLNHLKGVEYFQSILFITDLQKDKAKLVDLISRSAWQFDAVFKHSPKDWNASVAFEILQERMKNLPSGEADFQRRLQLLPQREVPVPFGIEGLPEGRH